MGGLDAIILARAQFAFTIGFHIVFPAFSIGLASFLMVLEGLWLYTNRRVYLDLFQYWVKAFALVFGMGVVSGLVMSYQFGTNWGAFADKAGPIVGPLMGYEVLTAFFLEAGFLGIMLFGMKKVGEGLHFTATCIVAFGTLLSGFWILATNSWMQTPQGYHMSPDGHFLPSSWTEIIFNPSFFYRFPHMILGCFLAVAFFVGAVGAYHLLRDRGNIAARTMFSMALWMATLVAPVQIFVGDMHGINTLEHQPAKVAAMEGDWETRAGQPLVLFALPNAKTESNDFQLAIPKIGSLILTHNLDGVVKGLKDFPADARPPVMPVFWAFRVMVGLGFLMLAFGLAGLVLRRGGRIYTNRWLQRAAVAMAPAGFIAILAGWTVTEVGRQPFTVYGMLRTVDSVSPIGLPGVATSLAAFAIVYFFVFGSGISFLLAMVAKPPTVGEAGPSSDQPMRSAGITPGPQQTMSEPHAAPAE